MLYLMGYPIRIASATVTKTIRNSERTEEVIEFFMLSEKISSIIWEKLNATIHLFRFKGAVHSKTHIWPLLVGNINL